MSNLPARIEPLHALLAKRWSPRSFSPSRRVEPEKLWSCFEAARWSPSSYNEQPWHFIYASAHDQPEAYATLSKALIPFNQSWARLAPVIILIASKRKFTKTGVVNPHFEYDAGQAFANFVIQA